MRHVSLTCKHHPNLRWQCKSIAFSPNHGYNGTRHIFYNGATDGTYPAECKCPASDLIFSPEEIEEQKTHPTHGPDGQNLE